MDQVEEIKSRLDVAEVVGGYVVLKQAGRNLKAPCPFHHEKTASFMVSPEKQIWHCFGCGEGGDVIKFVMKMEGVEFREALELLGRRAGIEVKDTRSSGDGKVKERLLEATALAVKYYQATLVKNPKALEYIKARGLSRASVIDFMIGYAPDSWEGLSKFLLKQGFSADELMKAGLANQKRGLYDLFRGRLMLTIADGQGRPVGFTGRVIGEGEPKYLNTPQTLLYDKSRAIYGLHLAKPAIREHDEVVLVEGNLDVVSSHQAGIKQVVAASGTALTLDQLKVLGRLTKNIKLAFDQDAAGLAATERAIELGQKLGLSLKMVEITGAKDPDELIQSDPKAWQKAIKEAKYIVDYLFDRYANQLDLSSAMGKKQFSDRLSTVLRRLADPVEQDHYVGRLAELTGVSPDAVRQKLAQPAPSSAPAVRLRAVPEPVQTEPHLPHNPHDRLEESVLGICLAYPDTRMALEEVEPSVFTTPARQALLQLLRAHPAAKVVELAQLLPEQGDYAKILSLRGEEEFSSLAPADRSVECFELVRRLQSLDQKASQSELAIKLREAQASGNTQLVRSLLEQYQALITEDS